MGGSSYYPLPRGLALAVIVAFSLAWGASSAYAVLSERPLGRVYVIEPWPANATVLGGGCLDNASPVVIASQGGLLVPEALVYTSSWGIAIDDFNPQAYCVGPHYVVIAGSYNETPALAVIRGKDSALIIELAGSGPASLNSVECRGSLIAAAGSSVEGTLIVKAGLNGEAKAWLVRYSAPVLSIATHAGSIYSLTASGVIQLKPNGTAKLYELEEANATWERLVEASGGLWLVGGLEAGNNSWAALAPLEGGRAILLRARGYDGLILDARKNEWGWIVYYRPGSYWDCLAHISGSAVYGVKLIWSGTHEVESVYMSEEEGAVTTTLVTGPRVYVVLACLKSVEEAHYWLDDRSILHESLIPVTERLVVRETSTPRPVVTALNARAIEIVEQQIQVERVNAALHFEEAKLKWNGPLIALTYAALSIVLASTLWRSFVGG